jgi:hypothetical protein
MAQRRHQAERAFEKLLRTQRIPYVAVNEARKSLLPIPLPGGPARRAGWSDFDPTDDQPTLKNFDFIVSGATTNLIVEVKGRSIPTARTRMTAHAPRPPRPPRLESWVTLDDVLALARWQSLFGPGYEAAFVFVYTCPPDTPPPDGLFSEVVELDQTWYALRAITLDDYRTRMKIRSPKWRTVHLPRPDFDRLSRPFAAHADPFHTSPLDQSPALEPLGA